MRGIFAAVVLTVTLISSEQVLAEEMTGEEIKALLEREYSLSKNING